MPIITYNNWQDGINTDIPADNMKDTELRQCDNGVVADRGGFRKRRGCRKLNIDSFDAEVEQIIEWRLSTGAVKLVAVVGCDLCIIDEAGNRFKKLSLASNRIGYVAHKDMLFFVDGSKYYVWGSFDYYSSDGTQTVNSGAVVKNYPLSTGVNAGAYKHFYRAKVSLGSIDLSSEDYGDTARWEDITDGDIADSIREVTPNGDVTNDLSPIKRCKFLVFHPVSLRFFAAGDSEDPTAVYFSEIDKPNFFKRTNKLYPVTSSGSITGLVVFLRSVLVSYKMMFMVWSGSDISYDATWKQLAIPTGCVAHDTIALTPVSLTFLGIDGVYCISAGLLNDDMVMVVNKEMFCDLSENKVKSIVKSMVHKESAKAVFHDGFYYLAYGDDSDNPRNNKELVLNWSLKSFVRFSGRDVNCYCSRFDGSLLLASRNYVLEAECGLDDVDVESGSVKPIKLSVVTKPYSLGSEARAWISKTVNRVFVSAQQLINEVSKVVFRIKSDYVSKVFDTDFNESLVYGRNYGLSYGFVDIVNQEAIVNQAGLRHQISFEDDSLGNELFVYGVGIEYDETSPEGSMIKGVRLTDEA